MKLARLKSTAKICATAALVALLAAAGTGTATALQADTTFDDVPDDHIFSDEISDLLEIGVLTASDADADDSFRSGEPVTMADMTRWMGNVAEKYDVETGIIDIVTRNTPSAGTLNRNGAAGVFEKFFNLEGPVDDHSFSDVTDDFADSVSSLETGGITVGCKKDSYCGTRPFTRGHAAAYIGRFVALHGASKAISIADDSLVLANANMQSLLSAYQYVVHNTIPTVGEPDRTEPAAPCSGGRHLGTAHQHRAVRRRAVRLLPQRARRQAVVLVNGRRHPQLHRARRRRPLDNFRPGVSAADNRRGPPAAPDRGHRRRDPGVGAESRRRGAAHPRIRCHFQKV